MALLATVVRRALKAAASTSADAAAAALALNYAALIDDARPNARYAAALDTFRILAAGSEDPAAAAHYRLIETALSVHSTTSDMGPKLLAALEALGMTPRARRSLAKGMSKSASSPLDELRERRRNRAG